MLILFIIIIFSILHWYRQLCVASGTNLVLLATVVRLFFLVWYWYTNQSENMQPHWLWRRGPRGIDLQSGTLFHRYEGNFVDRMWNFPVSYHKFMLHQLFSYHLILSHACNVFLLQKQETLSQWVTVATSCSQRKFSLRVTDYHLTFWSPSFPWLFCSHLVSSLSSRTSIDLI